MTAYQVQSPLKNYLVYWQWKQLYYKMLGNYILEMDSSGTLTWPTPQKKSNFSNEKFLTLFSKNQFFKRNIFSCPFARTDHLVHSPGSPKRYLLYLVKKPVTHTQLKRPDFSPPEKVSYAYAERNNFPNKNNF